MPKYLICDLSLFNSGWTNKNKITQEDILIKSNPPNDFILKNGVQTVQTINQLVNFHDYELVIYSTTRGIESQRDALAQFKEGCKRQGLVLSPVKAIAGYQGSEKEGIVQIQVDKNKPVALHTSSLESKSAMLQLLETTLGIERGALYVFNDFSNPNTSIPEGYQSHNVSDNHPLHYFLYTLLKKEEEASVAWEQGEILRIPTQNLCNGFLSIELSDSQAITVDLEDASSSYIKLKTTCPKTLDKLVQILNQLGSNNILRESTERIRVAKSDFFKLCPYLRRGYNDDEDESRIKQIKILCGQYLGYAWEDKQKDKCIESPESWRDLNKKERVMYQLYHANSLEKARKILEDNKDILTQNRTPWALLIIQAIAVILTFPLSLLGLSIHSKVTRGTWDFFKTESELVSDKISIEISKGIKVT